MIFGKKTTHLGVLKSNVSAHSGLSIDRAEKDAGQIVTAMEVTGGYTRSEPESSLSRSATIKPLFALSSGGRNAREFYKPNRGAT